MVSPIVFAIATGIGLLTDKYMLEATNFVEHYAVVMKPNDDQKELIKSTMYVGAILGMVTFGPISDIVGRRAGLLACSFITLAGAVLSTFAWNANVLIVARIVTGIGMGGEYPLASAHSAESAEAGNGARNVAVMYLFGSGGGPVVCDMVTYFLDISGLPPWLIWRGVFAVGSLLAFIGLVLRFMTTENSKHFNRGQSRVKGTRRNFFRHYWRPLLGTAATWMMFDMVEYGLKQNDAAIFSASEDGPYSHSILTVAATRMLVIPSLAFAPWLLTRFPSKYVQLVGLAGCAVFNLVLALTYSELKQMTLVFGALYIFQLSFQSLPGVTTLAIPAEIYPSAVKGLGAATSAACGKIGATIGSYYFTRLKDDGEISLIFWSVVGTSSVAIVLTTVLIPHYNGATLMKAEELAKAGRAAEACRMLFSGPQWYEHKSSEDRPGSGSRDRCDNSMEEGSANVDGPSECLA